MDFDLVVIGASLGGVQAARSALESGLRVALTEETDWIGGQMTAQAVPPDEHPWIESYGCTRTYRAHRDAIRALVRERYPVRDAFREGPFDPGQSSVSRVAHDPRLSLELLEGSLAPWVASGQLELLRRAAAVSATMDGDRIASVAVRTGDGATRELRGTLYIDGTDTGDLLPLVGAEYRTGAEGRAVTGEPHAPEVGDPLDMQPATWVACLGYAPGEDRTMPKPAGYDDFASRRYAFMDHAVLSLYGPALNAPTGRKFGIFDGGGERLFPLWSYRRIWCPSVHEPGVVPYDVTLLNWPQNDYIFGNLYEDPDAGAHREAARMQTLCLVYWLQTQCPRADGGRGYPGIFLCGDPVGTSDGLAKAPYIRESRRIVGLHTIAENEVNATLADHPPIHDDSVGVGCYPIDLHCTTRSNTMCFWPVWPFEIPLRAMVPVRIENLIPGCKNIATTHLTNGCFRLHPVEWNVGESAGVFAAECVRTGCTPKAIALDAQRTRALQERLAARGVEMHWPQPIQPFGH